MAPKAKKLEIPVAQWKRIEKTAEMVSKSFSVLADTIGKGASTEKLLAKAGACNARLEALFETLAAADAEHKAATE